MPDTHVWLYNPETKAHWQSPLDYAPIARKRGWEDSDAPAEEYDDIHVPLPAEEAPEDEQTSFDPSEHTVTEVQEYVAQYEDSAPGEVERVVEAERAGKNRTSITGD